jgi:hypothetical protein
MRGKATSKGGKERRWERYLGMAAEAGAIAMSLRDRPTRLDWAGAGLRVLGLAWRIRGEHRQATAGDPWSYFDADGLEERWVEVPSEFRKLVFEHIVEVSVDERFWDGLPDSARVCFGRVGEERIGWVEQGTDVADGPYIRIDRAEATYRALGARIWKRLGSRRAVYTKGGLQAEPAAADILPTAQLRALEDRVQRFLASDMPRSYLLVGPPGTGKSAAIAYLSRELGLSSLRVDLTALARHHYHAEVSVAASLETLLELLRPDLMVIDDLDRVTTGGAMLHFLERASRTCKVVMASANCADKMMGAALRPGRFDDIIRVDRLDPEVLAQLLGDDRELTARLAEAPVAYVAEFVKRRAVLGRERAVEELEELLERQRAIDARTDDGD